MMKKMLILALVLAVAGLANAGISLVKIDATSVAVVSTDTQAYNAYLTIGKGPAYNAVLTAAAGNLASIGATEDYGDGFDWKFITIAGGPGTVLAGQQLIVTLLNPAAQMQVGLFDSAGTAAQGDPVVLGIPEPMTMALLGLGGLFLRKRK